jgi:hypothetical protein
MERKVGGAIAGKNGEIEGRPTDKTFPWLSPTVK